MPRTGETDHLELAGMQLGELESGLVRFPARGQEHRFGKGGGQHRGQAPRKLDHRRAEHAAKQMQRALAGLGHRFHDAWMIVSDGRAHLARGEIEKLSALLVEDHRASRLDDEMRRERNAIVNEMLVRGLVGGCRTGHRDLRRSALAPEHRPILCQGAAKRRGVGSQGPTACWGKVLDLGKLDYLPQAAARTVGNLDVAAGALNDLSRDGEPKACARDILPSTRIDAEKRVEHLAEKLRRDARPFVLDQQAGALLRDEVSALGMNFPSSTMPLACTAC